MKQRLSSILPLAVKTRKEKESEASVSSGSPPPNPPLSDLPTELKLEIFEILLLHHFPTDLYAFSLTNRFFYTLFRQKQTTSAISSNILINSHLSLSHAFLFNYFMNESQFIPSWRPFYEGITKVGHLPLVALNLLKDPYWAESEDVFPQDWRVYDENFEKMRFRRNVWQAIVAELRVREVMGRLLEGEGEDMRRRILCEGEDGLIMDRLVYYKMLLTRYMYRPEKMEIVLPETTGIGRNEQIRLWNQLLLSKTKRELRRCGIIKTGSLRRKLFLLLALERIKSKKRYASWREDKVLLEFIRKANLREIWLLLCSNEGAYSRELDLGRYGCLVQIGKAKTLAQGKADDKEENSDEWDWYLE